MSKTTKTNQTTSQSQTQTPVNPDWVTNPLKGLTSQITALNGVPASNYVAQQGALQQQANSQGASSLTPGNPNYTGAAGLISGNSSVNPSDISKFMSPWTSGVVDTTNTLFDQNSGKQNAALAAEGAANGAFGGSRFGVAQGVLQGQQALDRGNLDAGLLSGGYDRAVSSAFADKNLGQTAGTNLTNVGNSQSATDIAKTAELAQLGGAQQQTAQATATAPISLTQAIASLLGQNQFGLFQGQTGTMNGTSSGTQTETDPLKIISSILGGVGALSGGGASGLASFFAPAH